MTNENSNCTKLMKETEFEDGEISEEESLIVISEYECKKVDDGILLGEDEDDCLDQVSHIHKNDCITFLDMVHRGNRTTTVEYDVKTSEDVDSERDVTETDNCKSDSLVLKDHDIESALNEMLSKFSKDSKVKMLKGRVIDKENTELEFLLPSDLEEQLGRINIGDKDDLKMCGNVIHKIEDTQTITFQATKHEPIMDLGTAIFNERRQMIGIIGYIFGKPSDMNYQVICKDMDTCDGMKAGEKVFCAPGVSEAYFTAVDVEDTAEKSESEEDFSEEEMMFEYAKTKGCAQETKKKSLKRTRHGKKVFLNKPMYGERPRHVSPFHGAPCHVISPYRTFLGRNRHRQARSEFLHPYPRNTFYHPPPLSPSWNPFLSPNIQQHPHSVFPFSQQPSPSYPFSSNPGTITSVYQQPYPMQNIPNVVPQLPPPPMLFLQYPPPPLPFSSVPPPSLPYSK